MKGPGEQWAGAGCFHISSPFGSSPGVRLEAKTSRAHDIVPKALQGPGREAALTLEESASPRHDVLDKGWGRK